MQMLHAVLTSAVAIYVDDGERKIAQLLVLSYNSVFVHFVPRYPFSRRERANVSLNLDTFLHMYKLTALMGRGSLTSGQWVRSKWGGIRHSLIIFRKIFGKRA